MIRKTMRIRGLRTSIKLEQEFWSYLAEIAAGRRMRLSALVNEVAEATPDHTNLASTLRTFALTDARQRAAGQEATAAAPAPDRPTPRAAGVDDPMPALDPARRSAAHLHLSNGQAFG
jgi:predicted DNA-binding ribbon-helix-helix protein